MAQLHDSVAPAPQGPSLFRRIMIGGAIALIFISLFLLPVKSNPAWPELWKVRPMLIAPLAGAAAGAFSYFMEIRSLKGGWQRIAARIISLIAYLIAMWLGFVLGLDGTLWN